MFGVWCFEFAFGMFDKDGNGYIMEPELKELLVTIHGDDPLHTGGVDRVMDVFDRVIVKLSGQSLNRLISDMRLCLYLFLLFKRICNGLFLGQRYWNRKSSCLCRYERI